MPSLDSPIEALSGINSYYKSRLGKLEIFTIRDLLYHIPNRYDDYSIMSKINLLQEGETVTILGTIKECKNIFTKHGKRIQKAMLEDETGTIDVVWYNQPFLTNLLPAGTQVTIAGTVQTFAKKLVFQSPDYEIIKDPTHLVHTGRLVPVYPETKGLTSKWLRTKVATVLPLLGELTDILPPSLNDAYHLPDIQTALRILHNPQNEDETIQAHRKLAFDELLPILISAYLRRIEWEKKTVGHKFSIADFSQQITHFIKSLPFELTSAQHTAVSEIMQDLGKPTPMNRLLEGDVGSGKTIVAAISMYIAHLNGFQSALMAPTEILATQHYETINKLLSPFGITVALVTGSKKPTELKKNKIQKNLKQTVILANRQPAVSPGSEHSFDIYIGTHALITEKLKISNLGLVVIDEQQRFGVEQRTRLREKGKNPHVLSMTATPIPRTIALTMHADLDLSVLDEMPKGRTPIKTWVVPPEKRQGAYGWIQKQIEQSGYQHQAFIICPLIEESESLTTVKSAKKEFDHLRKEVFPHLRLGLVHGRMKPAEKNGVLSDFKQGKFHILVATPVVEVGIDIPRATIILIEASDRFGLAQLHQLRGRVGRNNIQSYCLLFTDSANEKTIERLKAMETINSGPKLAEIDLKMRGAGDLYGTRQHGGLGLKYASFSDIELVKMSREATKILLKEDKNLTQFPLLRDKVQNYTIREVAPD